MNADGRSRGDIQGDNMGKRAKQRKYNQFHRLGRSGRWVRNLTRQKPTGQCGGVESDRDSSKETRVEVVYHMENTEVQMK